MKTKKLFLILHLVILPFSPHNSPAKLTFDKTGIGSSSVETSIVDTSTILGASTQVSFPMKSSNIPPEVSLTESFYKEVQT